MTLGFVGTGHITVAMVEGLCSAPLLDERIVVSPRNATNFYTGCAACSAPCKRVRPSLAATDSTSGRWSMAWTKARFVTKTFPFG